jgi:hypothetical protein
MLNSRSKKPLRRIEVIDTTESLDIVDTKTKMENEKDYPQLPQKSTRIKIEEVDSSSSKTDPAGQKDEKEEEEVAAIDLRVELPPSPLGVSKSRGPGRSMEAELLAAPPLGTDRLTPPPLPATFAQFTKDWRTLHTPHQRLNTTN